MTESKAVMISSEACIVMTNALLICIEEDLKTFVRVYG